MAQTALLLADGVVPRLTADPELRSHPLGLTSMEERAREQERGDLGGVPRAVLQVGAVAVAAGVACPFTRPAAS